MTRIVPVAWELALSPASEPRAAVRPAPAWDVPRLLLLVLVAFAARAEAQRQPGWEVRVAERVTVAPGAAGALEIAIAVDRGLSVSRDAAVIVDLAAPATVELKRRRLGREHAVDPNADAPRFEAALRATTAGDHTIRVRVRFWVCGGKVCRPVDVHRTAIVSVVAALAPDAGVDATDAPGDGAGRGR